MNVLSIQNVTKQYHNHKALDEVSFDVGSGKIFGLLGPNGAGKTSLIRIITAITGADSGQVFLNGEPLSDKHIANIGYMPEERGLYKKMKVSDQLLYLAQLKGMKKADAITEIKYWFEKFDINSWWDKKVEELSKGMQQKIQFITTVLHKPDLLILDEPFSGLDPINTNLIKDEIHNLNQQGTSIIFSTHRMEQVEEVCENIVLINQGKIILNGSVTEIKQQFKENKFSIKYAGDFDPSIVDGIEVTSQTQGNVKYQIKEGHSPKNVLKQIIDNDIDISEYKEILPSLNEIFIKQVEN